MSSWKSSISDILGDHKMLFSHMWRVLIWEKPFFPLVTFFTLTLFFWMLSMWSASVLTTFALISLLGVIIDVVGPPVYPSLEPSLGMASDSQFEACMAWFAVVPSAFDAAISGLNELKRKQKLMMSGALGLVFVILSLLGRVNNYYLCYLFCLLFLLAPGALNAMGITIDGDFKIDSIGRGGSRTGSFSSSSPTSPPYSTPPSSPISSSPTNPISGTSTSPSSSDDNPVGPKTSDPD